MIYKLKPKLIEISPNEDGSVAFVTRDEDLVNEAKAVLGREKQEGLLLKIFHFPVYANPSLFYWGKVFNIKDWEHNTRSYLREAIEVQNLFAFQGLAPRCYGIFIYRNPETQTEHYTVLMEDAGEAQFIDDKDLLHQRNTDFYEKLKTFEFSNDINLPFADILSSNNIVNGKLVDWQGASFKGSYLDHLKKRYLEKTGFGDSKYQTVPELEIEDGIRKTSVRYTDLGLSKYDFGGKTVIDIGSSGGNFLNYAIKWGAKYAVGVDWEKVISGAFELSNYLSLYNIDYFSCNLSEELTDKALLNKPYDLAIFTSMTTHVGVPDYLHTLAKMMIIEINHTPQIEPTLKALAPYWDVKYIGQSTDFGDRSIYHCFNKVLAK